MKRRLLLQLMAILLTAAGYAANTGDYIYTPTAKYKVTGENLITNGNFSLGDGFQGWTSDNGGNVSNTWSVESAQGPASQNVVMSQGASAEEGTALMATWELSNGLYTISYWVKATSAVMTTLTAGSTNCVTITADGRSIAEAVNWNTEWLQVIDTIDVRSSAETVVFKASNVATGTMLTGFEINNVTEVFDTRITDRLFSYASKLLADENLTAGKEDFEALIVTYQAMTVDPSTNESQAEMTNYVEMIEEAINDYLDKNGGDIVGVTLTDWSTWSQVNYNSMATRGTWTFEGGRWGFTANNSYLEFNAGDGYIASAGIQQGQSALNVGLRTAAGAMDVLPAGKYFFSIEAQAVAASNRANPYGADHSVAIVGPSIYVGNDSTVLENDTLNGYYWKRYYKVAEIKEGEEMRVGFHFPVLEGKTGGRYSLRNPQVRQLGVSKADMQFNYDKANIIIQQQNLKERLDTYPTELKDYLWEQDSLLRAIAISQPVYEASLQVIDAEGNVVDATQVNADYTALLLEEVNRLGRARSWVISSNAIIDNLKQVLETANTSLGAASNANAAAAQRTALQGAISAGQVLIDGISTTNQSEEFAAAIAAIQKAQEEFEATTATRANPTEIVIKNGSFQDFANNNNVTAAGTTKDWNWTLAASASRWEIRDNETLSEGHGASIWRGTTVQLDGKAQQIASLPYEGLYEYRAQAYISEERISELTHSSVCEILYDEETGEPNDTIYKPNIRLFFGLDGRPDSITISKCYLGVKDDGTYFTRGVSGTAYPGQVYATYSLFFTKSGASTTTVEFGLEAFENWKDAGANGFGFGANKIYYVGNEQQYLTDTRQELSAAVSSARQTAAGVDNYWAVKLNRYIGDAEKATTAKQMQNALHGLKEVESRLKGIITDVKGIFADEEPQTPAAKGVYTLSGVKVADSTNGLKPGLYIINGKKHIIK